MTLPHLTLSWDISVIVFFCIIIAYSFILGKHECIRVIICTYIAAVASMGINSLLQVIAHSASPLLAQLGLSLNVTVLSVTKLLLFVVIIVLLAAKSGLDIAYTHETGAAMNTLLTAAFGFASAGLLFSTLLTFVTGTPVLQAQLTSLPALSTLAEQSRLISMMIDFQPLWFALPAILLIIVGCTINK